MSAIWGKIVFQGTPENNTGTIMCSPYRDKCRLDRIEELTGDRYYIGAGIQYITPEAKLEKQPVETETGGHRMVFAADCMLDNREELYAELRPRSALGELADGELMRQAWIRWGTEALTRMRGIYSLAAYDLTDNRVVLAVDPTSSRCLYYSITEDGVLFSSLIEPILKARKENGYHIPYWKDYLVAPGLMPNLSARETPYQEIYKVEAGTFVTMEPGEMTITEYSSPADPAGRVVCRNASAYGAYFRQLYEDCVGCVLRSEQETGIALSSGLDSATVGALAADRLNARGQQLNAYTYVPCESVEADRGGHTIYDETEPVKELVALHENIVTHFLNRDGRNAVEHMETGLEIMEIPYKAYGNMPSLCELYEQAYRDGCRIVLNGQFGNSTVSHGYIDDVLYDLYARHHTCRFLINLNRYSKQVRESRRKALRGCRNYFRYAGKTEKEKHIDYEPDNEFLRENILGGYAMEDRFRQSGLSVLKRIPIRQQAYREGLCRKAVYSYIGEMETKMSLRFGIVLRDPTRDIRMIQFCYHLPYELFAHGGTPRWLIRRNLQDVLPEEITRDWLRYSVQNADCFARIQRDWKELCSKLKDQMDHVPAGKENGLYRTLLHYDRMKQFLEEYREDIPEREESRLDGYLFAHMLVLFAQSDANLSILL